MSKKKQNKVEINIYGGNIQVMPNVREVEQHIHTKDGETVIINKFKPSHKENIQGMSNR